MAQYVKNRKTELSSRKAAANDLLSWIKTESILFRDRDYFCNNQDYTLYKFLVSNTIRHKRKYQFLINQLTNRSVAELDDEAVICLMLGLVQLEKEAKIDHHAAVNETVNLAAFFKKPFLKGFINANLRSYIRREKELNDEVKQQLIEIRTSHETEMVNRWKGQFGELITDRLCEANNVLPQVQIVINPAFDREEVVGDLSQQGFDVRENEIGSFTIGKPSGLFETKWAKQGAFLIQDFSSQLVNRLITDLPKKRILDACAAPGGKLFHLEWSYSKDIELLVALEISAIRIKRLKYNKNLFNSKALLIQMDALRTSFKTQFDLVLIDAPCSSTGTIRKHPEIKWNREKTDTIRNHEIQLALLRKLKDCVRSGGHILYATCSLEEEENQHVIEEFLEEFQNEFLSVPFQEKLTGCGKLTAEGYLQCLTTESQMGSFAALLQKK